MKPIFLALISILLGAVGQLLMKTGATSVGESSESLPFTTLLKMITNVQILGGLACYGVSTVFWLFVLAKLPLSYAYPLISLGYVIVFAFSYFVLHEQISVIRFTALLIIVSGVVLLYKS